MASIYGDDGGTVTDGRRRRPTNAGPGYIPPYGGGTGTPPRPTSTTTAPPIAPNEPNPNTPAPEPPKPPAPNFGSLSGGFDFGKLSDPNKHSFKYDYARTVSAFDPRKGFTGDVLSALNGLGYADFYSPGGDKLGIRNVTSKGVAAGMDPRDFLGDFINAFDAQNDATKWGFDWFDDATTASGGNGFPSSIPVDNPDPRVFSGPGGGDMSWLTDLLKSFATPNTPAPPAAPPIVMNMPGAQPAAQYSQPSPTFGGGYVQPAYQPSGNTEADATSLLAMALPRLLQDPAFANDPLVRRLMATMQGS